MHELSVCQALVNQVVEIAQQNSAHTVRVITLHIGPLSGVEPALLVSAFPLAAAGTVAASAQLVIEPQPLRVHCQTCGADTEATPNRLLCGICGDYHTQLLSGDELLLANLELIT
ncbi:[NiFe] hydrogenase nickel incorporation protein HypA [Sulfuriferula multivorans]|uniref:Hydrogenase maturation factor HypA n=1 Tax=Sulfuriferula multivorans TaxID=1559896 RepID=A0A401JZL2_9PROT|nr:hydrogenase maturation nickel metallochaperone HypA [Sulfuriferula multivorans]GCB02068.1 [NiFe] hydrogenase nickel incorporation protein HypA [Sulfuriferula multivorans]